LFVKRPAKSGQEKEFKIHCINNFQGGLDFYYYYYGQNVKLLSKTNHKDSVLAIEQLLKDFANGDYNGPETALDIGLAVVELNSGLGQANLLHKAVLDMAPSNVDVFLEWTEDLALIAMNSNVSVD